MSDYAASKAQESRRLTIGWMTLLAMPGAMGWLMVLVPWLFVAPGRPDWLVTFLAGLFWSSLWLSPLIGFFGVCAAAVAIAWLRKRRLRLDWVAAAVVIAVNVSYALCVAGPMVFRDSPVRIFLTPYI